MSLVAEREGRVLVISVALDSMVEELRDILSELRREGRSSRTLDSALHSLVNASEELRWATGREISDENSS